MDIDTKLSFIFYENCLQFSYGGGDIKCIIKPLNHNNLFNKLNSLGCENITIDIKDKDLIYYKCKNKNIYLYNTYNNEYYYINKK
jgi:hypothetical protein